MNIEKSEVRDIHGDLEIRLLVDSFYVHVREDDLLGPVFDAQVQDWSKHLPTMYAFWASILFGKAGYQGNPFAKHLPLPVGKEHFDRWIVLFMETVDQLFSGPKAEQAKGAAKSIAHSFQVRMGINPFEKTDRIL